MTGSQILPQTAVPLPGDLQTMGAQQGVITILQQIVQAIYALNNTMQATFPNWVAVPATAADPGTPGQVAYESGWLYVCVATDTWERTALATF